MLITRETKLEIVKKHLEEGVTLKELSEEYGIHSSNIKFYVALYRKHGESVFTNEEGFKIEKIVEPKPSEELLEKYPDYYDLYHKPDFLIVKAKAES